MIQPRRHSEGKRAGEMPKARTQLTPGAARRSLFSAAVLVIGFLSGCGAARPSKYYQLTVPADAGQVEKADAVPVTLLLGAMQTSHLYREDRIVYGNNAEQLGTYEYERWAEPPADMIGEVFLRELRASGRYRAVHYRRSNMQGDFALRGRLYDFKELTGGQLSLKWKCATSRPARPSGRITVRTMSR
jgi:ABC-type uncharacterized transport system auxiliary subunit